MAKEEKKKKKKKKKGARVRHPCICVRRNKKRATIREELEPEYFVRSHHQQCGSGSTKKKKKKMKYSPFFIYSLFVVC